MIGDATMEIDFKIISTIPVLVLTSSETFWSRVYGARQDLKQNRWFFPAYPPFLDNVLHDLEKVNDTCTFTQVAKNWLVEQKTLEEMREYVSKLKLPVKSYEHQLDGLSQALRDYRHAFGWDAGTGKTKIIIDAVKELGLKTLVLCPVVALDVWATEAEKHSGGTLKVIVFRGNKLSKLNKFKDMDADIFVTSYGSARTQGIPTLYEPAQKALRSPLSPVLPPALANVLQRINNAKEQKRLAIEWLKGRALNEIRQEIDTLIKGPQWVLDLPYSMIVADESHQIKNMKSAQTNASLVLARKAARRYLLSGTISQGDPRDLYPQAKFLAPSIIPGDYDQFCKRHVSFAPWNKHVVLQYEKLDILNRQITPVLSVKKLEECITLPSRQDINTYFSLSNKQINMYNRAVRKKLLTIPGEKECELEGANRINKLLQICSGFVYIPRDTEVCDTCKYLEYCVEHGIEPGSPQCKRPDTREREVYRYTVNPKLAALQDLLENLVEGSHKSIVWAHFKVELDMIEQLLRKKKWKYVRVDGSTSQHIKKYEHTFQTDAKCLVYLGQISTGISITLTAAPYTIYYSRNWKLEDWLQSRGRNYRIGQKKKTVVYRLIGKGSVEKPQLLALDARQDMAKMITQKIDCLTCTRYEMCLREKIEPWTNLCILERDVKRRMTTAQIIEKERP
jgi:SNF2 family DNA or RNA helicase